MKIFTVELDVIAQLNSDAKAVYLYAVETSKPGADLCELARQACSQVASDAGLNVVAVDSNDSSRTVALQETGGNMVNLWTHSPDERATDDDFEGIGFDANLEWYTDRLQQAQDAATEEKRAGRELDRALAAGH